MPTGKRGKKSKKEIDRDYYIKHKNKVLERVAKYQEDNPEIHRKASREYERRKRVKIIGKIIPDKKLGNKVVYFKGALWIRSIRLYMLTRRGI